MAYRSGAIDFALHDLPALRRGRRGYVNGPLETEALATVRS
jgi:hypothetical protein